MHPLQHQKSLKRLTNTAFLLLLVLAWGLNGCSDKSGQGSAPSAAKKPGQAISTGPTSSVTGTAPTEAQTEYIYMARGRRDPFSPIVESEGKKTKRGELPPLERYNLSELKLSGVVWGGFGYSALIEGPDGKGYFVHDGNVIGVNRGVIRKITQNQIIIEEKFKNYLGEVERKQIIMELRKKQEEKP